MESLSEDSLHVILMKIMRLHYLRTQALLDNTGIYPGQPPLLFALFNKDGKSQKELADTLKVKPATINVTIKRLEKTGFILRRIDEKDQRVTRIFLTEKGKNICNELLKINKQIEEECFYSFTVEEKVLLRRLLIQVRENLLKVCTVDDSFCHCRNNKNI